MKTIKVKTAMPIYLAAAVWLIAGLLCRMYLMRNICIVFALSAAVYILAERFLPKREIQVREKADSGDRTIDKQIEEGRALLDSLKASNDAIPDPKISAALDRMVRAGESIFAALEKDTSRSTQVRRFMNYYLPTTDKLLKSYRDMNAIGNKGENVRSAMQSVERSMDMIASAFEKQLDCLYRDESLDIQTDIDALETVISAEGLGQQRQTMTMH